VTASHPPRAVPAAAVQPLVMPDERTSGWPALAWRGSRSRSERTLISVSRLSQGVSGRCLVRRLSLHSRNRGWFPAACNRVGETTDGATHDERRGTRWSPNAADGSPRPSALIRHDEESGGELGRRLGSGAWVAMLGSQAWPVGTTACRCRKIAAAITVCAPGSPRARRATAPMRRGRTA